MEMIKTSDGIYVNYRNHKLNVGDKIELEGRVREIFGDGYGSKYKSDLSITQINALKTTKISENTILIFMKLIKIVYLQNI